MTNIADSTEVDGLDPEDAEQLLARVFDDQTVTALTEAARTQGLVLLGDGGLLQQLTKRFLEAALEGEMDAHLGHPPTQIGHHLHVLPAPVLIAGERAQVALPLADPGEEPVDQRRASLGPLELGLALWPGHPPQDRPGRRGGTGHGAVLLPDLP